MPYDVDENQLMETSTSWQKWVVSLVKKKVEEIRSLDDPYSQGGKYREHWVYPVGKLQIVAQIDSDTRTVKLIRLIKLP